jgi:hypothetical protein
MYEAIIQLAREAQVVYLVTHNVRDVSRAAQFGIRVVRPAEFLEKQNRSPLARASKAAHDGMESNEDTFQRKNKACRAG